LRPFTSTITPAEARARLASAVRPIDRTETVELAGAAGRVAACDVRAAVDVPPFARSSMDGYAVLAADTAGASSSAPRRLRVVDRIYTGQPSSTTIVSGCCAEIATGAPMPAGADAVLIVEDTARAADDRIEVMAGVSPGQNIGRRGSDMAAGDIAVHAGDLLTPGRIGAAGAVGCAALEIFARPRVAILSTGNEIVAPGEPLPPGRVFDVNRFTLAALAEAHGAVAERRGPVADTVDALTRALDACAGADVIIFSGGSSVGERDLTVDALAARGARTIFHGVAIRPGKPTLFATIGGTPFFGMPGNPASCLSQAYVLLVPFLRALARLPPHQPRVVRAPLAQRIDTKAGRHQIYSVYLSEGAVFPAFKGSGDITSLSRADGYIEIPADITTIETNTLVDVTFF
jgi:molybdenum cofactor synthesis domain-containing protein